MFGFQAEETKKVYNYRLTTNQYDNWIRSPSNVHPLPVVKQQWHQIVEAPGGFIFSLCLSSILMIMGQK